MIPDEFIKEHLIIPIVYDKFRCDGVFMLELPYYLGSGIII